MTQTAALIIFVILLLISAVLSGFGFYQDEIRKKKEKEQQAKLEKKVNSLVRKFNKLDKANDESINIYCENSQKIYELNRKFDRYDNELYKISDKFDKTTRMTIKLKSEIDAWFKNIEPRIKELKDKNNKGGKRK